MQLRGLRPLPFTTAGSGVTHGTGLATVGEVSYMLTRPLWQTVAQNVRHRVAIRRGADVLHVDQAPPPL